MILYSEIKQTCRRIFSLRQIGTFLILFTGLALATIMFSIGYGYSSASLPYKDAKHLVAIGRQNNSNSIPYLPNSKPFFEWKEQKNLFTDMTIFVNHGQFRIRTPNGNRSIGGIEATTSFFDVLGVSFPGLEEWKRSVGTPKLDTVVFTHKIGIKEFGYSSIGQLYTTLEGSGIIVGGILPANFALPREDSTGSTRESGIMPVSEGSFSSGTVIARLAPGITPQIAEQVLNSKPDEDAVFWGKIVVKPLQNIMAESSRSIVWGSWGLSGLVLILCSANLSGILLVRCNYKLREYAIRTAHGARFFDLIRLLLMELTSLSVIAAIAAWVVGRAVITVVGNEVPIKYLSFGRPVFGMETVIFLIIGTVVVISLSASFTIVVIGRNYWQGFSRRQWEVFHSHRWMRMLFTVGQTAIATLLLSVSYMAIRGYLDMFNKNIGVDANVRVVSVLPSPMFSDSAREITMQNTLNALRGGDTSAPVAFYSGTLFDGFISNLFFNSSSPASKMLKPGEPVQLTIVSPGFFRTVKARILAGREFNEQDNDEAVMLNETFVRRMGWSPMEAVGKSWSKNGVVIGVVNDFPVSGWNNEVSLTFFVSSKMYSGNNTRSTVNYIIHPDALPRVGNIERVIMQIDPDAIITRNVKWSELLGESVRGQTFAAISVVFFTIVAIAIVVIGITNTVMFIIARRTRDIAVHVAMGAQSRHVCWFVMNDMVKAGICGVIIGGLASWWVGKMVAHFIYQGERYQNLSGLILMSLVMVMIIAVASLIPTLRALRIEPSRAFTLE